MMMDIIKSESGKEVNFLAIKDFAKVSIGEFVHKSKQNPSGKYPVYNGGTGNTGFYDEYNRTANKIIVSARGANAGYVNRVFVDFWSGNSCYSIDVIDENVDWNYIYYCLKNGEVKLLGEQQKGGIPAVSKKQVEQFKIPLPSLPIQQEIVRILDTFTNLTAELTARRKQYEYYRDELLTFGEDVPRMTLKDISVSVSSGKNKEKEQEGMYPVYGSTGVIGRTNTAKYSKEQILVARVGANAGFVHKANGTYDVSDNTIIVELKDNYNLQYVYYILQKMNLRKYAKGGGQPLVTAGELKKIEIPIPDINEQDRVVSILDKFTGISTSFDSGLPAEIAARQKQYEYYRERLLSFKESHR